jgi:nucleoside-diphosphate-sugar epimerase
MIVAVTGGTGFIGKKLISRLIAQGDTVRLLTRKAPISTLDGAKLKIYNCDLVTASSAEFEDILDGVKVLYHCAGQISDTSLMRALHVHSTRRLAEAAVGRITRWVQLSSVGVYGPVLSGIVGEDATFSPRGEYEITKAESEILVAQIAKRGGFEYTVLRPSNVYGAAMTNRSLYGLIAMIHRRLFFFIGKYGASANYIHVDNVVEAMLLCGALSQAAGQTYNLSDYRVMESFVGAIAECLSLSPTRIRLPEPLIRMFLNLFRLLPATPLSEARVDALTGRAVYSNEKIWRELGYRHLVSMEDGINDLVDYWRRVELR